MENLYDVAEAESYSYYGGWEHIHHLKKYNKQQ